MVENTTSNPATSNPASMGSEHAGTTNTGAGQAGGENAGAPTVTGQRWHLQFRDLFAGYVKNQPVIQGFTADLTGPGLWLVQGSNGAGKSTLLEVLSGYLPPMAGHVLLNGEDLHHRGFTSAVSLLRHDPELVPFLSLGDNLALFARRYGVQQGTIDEIVAVLELQPHLRKLPSELSTGTLRKAWLVCGMVNSSPVVAFDEPLNGLDSGATDVVARLLLEKAQRQLVIVIAHHVPARFAEAMAGHEPLEGSAGALRCVPVTSA